MDATPIRVSARSSGGWARQIELGVERRARAASGGARRARARRHGGRHGPQLPGRLRRARDRSALARDTGLAFREATDHFEAQGARDAAVEASGALRTLAASRSRRSRATCACSRRGRAAGSASCGCPRPAGLVDHAGQGEPGDLRSGDPGGGAGDRQRRTRSRSAGSAGQLELNATIPLIARNLLESIRLLANVVARVRRALPRAGSKPIASAPSALDRGQPRDGDGARAARSATTRAAEIAKRRAETGARVRELCLERGVLPPEELERLLDPRAMTGR